MPAETTRHGAYLCISAQPGDLARLTELAVPPLIERLGLHNEFHATGQAQDAVAFLSRVDASAGDIPDALTDASAVLHVASGDVGKVAAFVAGIERLLATSCSLRVLSGRTAATRYTGGAMHDFAYARQLAQQHGEASPNAFLLPLRKLPEWWAKDWMERHTYFLPRFDENGRMVSEGHPLAAAAGVPALMRRTYVCDDGYDFLTYFECTDAHVATFHAVCGALRDVRRNPEWQFVREGPTWHGRRMPSWSSLWQPASGASPTTAAR